MFGFSFAELALVALVAFIFIKPEDLPEIMRALGKFAGKLKAYTREITDMFDENKTEAKVTKVLGDDGKFHVAFDVNELENLSAKPKTSIPRTVETEIAAEKVDTAKLDTKN